MAVDPEVFGPRFTENFPQEEREAMLWFVSGADAYLDPFFQPEEPVGVAQVDAEVPPVQNWRDTLLQGLSNHLGLPRLNVQNTRSTSTLDAYLQSSEVMLKGIGGPLIARVEPWAKTRLGLDGLDTPEVPSIVKCIKREATIRDTGDFMVVLRELLIPTKVLDPVEAAGRPNGMRLDRVLYYARRESF